jgi:hypothetical protein
MSEPITWLLQSEPWVVYRARRDILGQPKEDGEVKAARRQMLAWPPLRNLLNELEAWPGSPLKNHKSAGHLLHKLSFAAELGLNQGDANIAKICRRILEHRSPEGPLQILTNIPTVFGGSGKDEWLWTLCDAPLILYALTRFGLGEEPVVKEGTEYLTALVRENGWPCAATSALGKFHGPGKKEDPCPYANLIMLKLLALQPEMRTSAAAQTGIEAQLSAWERRRDTHMYLFYMGTDFCKIKAPLVWYDILHVLDVLTQFPAAINDRRMQEMVGIVREKTNEQGQYTPESIWQAWKDWDFGQKRAPSPGITYFVMRVLKRAALN